MALYRAAGGFSRRLGQEIDRFLVPDDDIFGNDVCLVAIRPRECLSRHDRLLSHCQKTFLRPRGLGGVFLFGLNRGKRRTAGKNWKAMDRRAHHHAEYGSYCEGFDHPPRCRPGIRRGRQLGFSNHHRRSSSLDDGPVREGIRATRFNGREPTGSVCLQDVGGSQKALKPFRAQNRLVLSFPGLLIHVLIPVLPVLKQLI